MTITTSPEKEVVDMLVNMFPGVQASYEMLESPARIRWHVNDPTTGKSGRFISLYDEFIELYSLMQPAQPINTICRNMLGVIAGWRDGL